MELGDDPELRNLLREWEAPPVPPSVEVRVFRSRQPWWRFLVTGHVRVPVPVAVCLALLIAVLAWRIATPAVPPPPHVVVRPERIEVPVERVVERIVYRDRPAPPTAEGPAELLPVTELRARIIRGGR